MTDLLKPPPATQIRQELLEAVRLDLLGPAGGEEEEVDEPSLRDRYLVGMLAPRRQEVAPEEFDDLAVAGPGSPEEGATEANAPPTKTMFPSSFGLTGCVAPEAEAFRVVAAWGHYTRQKSAAATRPDGSPLDVWKRKPRRGVSPPIPLRPGPFAPWHPDPEVPEVVVQGLVRRREDHWSVTVFLVNGQVEPQTRRDSAWLFQPELTIEAPDGAAIFTRVPRRRDPGKLDPAHYDEEQALEMLYRHQAEFALGHGVSVHAEPAEGRTDRAVRLRTRVVPVAEVARATPPTADDFPGLARLVVDMKALAELPPGDLPAALEPLVSAYDAWIAGLEARHDDPDLAEYREQARKAPERCRVALARIRAGITLLVEDAQAAEAFRFANRAMWQQRVHTLLAERARRGEPATPADFDDPRHHSWYPFQLAFILLNLPGITRLDHPDRAGEHEAIADLLWFPTGGGKTEAYLGLSAYTIALRRLQGVVAGRPGEHGVAVLMRYTLRLLTLQQFQRAAALVCACETIRREDPARWGREPFRIGLWVGQRATPNTTEQAAEAIKQGRGQGRGGVSSPAQLTNCPWCGAAIVPGRDIHVETVPKGRGRTLIYCGDPSGSCQFSRKLAPGEGLPVLVVDEEIYRRLPALLIATVDKFAQMPWNGKVQMLFGQVDGYCPRHGFRSPEVEDSDSHPKKDRHPAARSVPCGPLRPPDLIIQDELHLISGPLGTLVGLYETAVDALCSWEVGGRTVRPKVIASTATIRKAGDQVYALFLRQLRVFPPHGLDARDSFFALQREPGEPFPSRLYLGICAPGRRLKAALIRVYVAFLAAGQQLYERYGKAADPWMTLVGYFNSMRELGGMRRLVDDDVASRLKKMDRRGLARRLLDTLDELTSRKGSADIPEVLDHLEIPFDPAVEARRKARQGSRKDLPRKPLDVLLATNMVSVGVDVKRLGLMVVAGQPKTTAEYIQATSRVGRTFPGVVCTVSNWARPRDLSHYETFAHYHATFYKHVEALSVTPFAPGALSRGLTALLVSRLRLRGSEFNANDRAGRVDRNHPLVQAALDVIIRRAHLVGNGEHVKQAARDMLNERLDEWLAQAQNRGGGSVLGYRDAKDEVTVPLLRQPGLGGWDNFTCLNSLRDVEPTVGLIMDDRNLDEDPNFILAVAEDAAADGGDPP